MGAQYLKHPKSNQFRRETNHSADPLFWDHQLPAQNTWHFWNDRLRFCGIHLASRVFSIVSTHTHAHSYTYDGNRSNLHKIHKPKWSSSGCFPTKNSCVSHIGSFFFETSPFLNQEGHPKVLAVLSKLLLVLLFFSFFFLDGVVVATGAVVIVGANHGH